ncbi:MAG: hypothetical protein HFK10_02865 [Clostridia bacterium]|nr:hypothetical protein [Clostridia bacterium]
MTIIDSLRTAARVLVVSHIRPDGDTLGAALAVKAVCDRLHVPCDVVCDDEVPATYRFLPGAETINTHLEKKYPLCVAVDCGDIFRMGKFRGYIESSADSVNIDHHKTNDSYAKHNYVRSASSTCEILYGQLEKSGLLDEVSAVCLYCGLSTDTGNFMHSNTDAHVFKVAADLVEKYGVVPNALVNKLYRSKPYHRLRLIARAIESMRFFEHNAVCMISVQQSDLDELGCALSDTEGLIDYAMDLGTTEIGICMTEQGNQYKVSLRSKGFDVAAVAAQFGGGGHTAAAGCIVKDSYENAVERLLGAVRNVR